ncbi:phosphoglycerate mutase [Nocardioides sp. Soil777]|uniref:SixA phosphatase family protein n=1 Tax=Nocardioides sp. Soil777 TaxID=1736409 RepID=UPI0007038425|nr:histidine phosphatase family protein [Nocardioides sp. Soil777]KRF04423.1 phosphoglycerate mutase [Nocardioides sp. Soil777]
MRHAKAESWGESDQGRTLEPRGRDDAAAAGRWLAALGFVPDHALVSTSVRTRETWEAVAGAAGWESEPDYDTGLYAAGPEAALDLIREVPPHATAVIVIGHNPTMAYLAQLLDDGAGDADAGAAMAGGYPTSALTVLEYDGAWVELDMASASVVAFHVGRAE